MTKELLSKDIALSNTKGFAYLLLANNIPISILL